MMRPHSTARGILLATLALALAGCGMGSQTTAPKVEDPVTPPTLAGDFTPELSDSTQDELQGFDGTVHISIHVGVTSDGTARSVQISQATPEGKAVTVGFANDVAETLRKTRFVPATRRGVPVDAEFDFEMEAIGGKSLAGSPEGTPGAAPAGREP